MQISLPPELLRMVEGRVASGLYRDESDVIAEALRHVQQTDKNIKKALAPALKQAAEGKWVDFDPKAIKAEIRAKRKAR